MRKEFNLGDTVYSEFSERKGFVVDFDKHRYLDVTVSFTNEIYETNSFFFYESRIVMIEKNYLKNTLTIPY